MDWMLVACFWILYQYGAVHVAVKMIGAAEGSRTRKLVWQFFFAAVLALITASIAGRLELNWPTVIVALIGAANAFGCYCHWRAYDISMSRTAMLSSLDDLLAIVLGCAFLGELGVLTPVLTAGIVISLVSGITFSVVKYRDKAGVGPQSWIMGWVIGYTLAWSIAKFSMRFFSVQGLSILNFVAAWYVGSWFGALLTRFVIMGRGEAGPPLNRSQLAKVLVLAVSIWTALMLAYWTKMLVPLTVSQPIQLVAEMSIPAIIALIFFGEARSLSRTEMVVMVGGFIGVVLIAVGF